MQSTNFKTLIVPAILFVSVAASSLWAVDPTFLHRYVPDVAVKAGDLSTPAAHYKPIFGIGDSGAEALKGMARYGELVVDQKGASATVSYPAEEQVYYVLNGAGTLLYADEKVPFKTHDFAYLPFGIKHGVANPSGAPLRLLVMGFKIPAGTALPPPAKLQMANSDNAKEVELSFHGPTVLYKLLLGPASGTRNMLNVANIMQTLFIMNFAPGGTNVPHNHDRLEEIYYVLSGRGDMVAGGGMDGTEGKYPVKVGDAYFFRMNATVGFYSGTRGSEQHAQILAVQSEYPFAARPGGKSQ